MNDFIILKIRNIALHSEHLNDQKIQGEIVKNDVIIKNTFIFGQTELKLLFGLSWIFS